MAVKYGRPFCVHPWRGLPNFFLRKRNIPARLIPPEVQEKMKRTDSLNKMLRVRGNIFATSWWRAGSEEIAGARVFLARDHPHLDRLAPTLPKAARNLYRRSMRVAFARATDASEGFRRLEEAERALEKYEGPIYAA